MSLILSILRSGQGKTKGVTQQVLVYRGSLLEIQNNFANIHSQIILVVMTISK